MALKNRRDHCVIFFETRLILKFARSSCECLRGPIRRISVTMFRLGVDQVLPATCV